MSEFEYRRVGADQVTLIETRDGVSAEVTVYMDDDGWRFLGDADVAFATLDAALAEGYGRLIVRLTRRLAARNELDKWIAGGADGMRALA